MVAATKCEKCGHSVDPAAGCQVCMLHLGLSESGVGGARVGGAQANVQGGSPGSLLPSIDELNQRFPQLQISRLIGRGGMGAIYQARQTSLDREVALKLIAKEVSQDPQFVERFEREAKTLAKLSHPNIVTVYDFGYTADGVAYLVMEFVDGINLREAMKSQSVGPDDALNVIATTCRALEYAHSRGVIHRDIKPENILLGEDGSLKVVDFGIAKIVDDSVRTPTLTATRQVLGSLHYLAPEQLESPDQVDHRVDLYALGVVFYELLTGELPLGRYEPPSALFQRADKQFDQVVLKSLSRKPSNRYQSAKEFGAEIQQLQSSFESKAFASGLGSATTPPPLPKSDENQQPTSVPFNSDLPFNCDTFGGLAEVLGLLFVTERDLCIEFRTRDKIMGVIKSKATLVRIPFSRLTRCELVTGVFSSKLLISANSLALLNDLPNSESGTVTLQIKRHNVPAAKRLLSAIGFGKESGPLAALGAPEFGSPEYSRQAIFGGLMVLCGILNLGCLAISQVINANANHSSNVSLPSVAIMIAVVFGPIALMQLVGGVLNFVLAMRPLNGVLAIISMLPISPAWLISFPAAIWASTWIRGNGSFEPTDSKPSWGATTLMFIRESRWAKFLSAANAIGLVGFVVAGIVYLGGLYPTTVSYRIAGQASFSNSAEIVQKLRARLVDVAPHATLNFDEVVERVMIRDWQFNAAEICDALKIESAVQLAWLEFADGKPEVTTWLPIAGDLAVAELATGSEGLSTTLGTNRPLVDLAAEMVASVRSKPDELSIELSKVGRELLGEARPDTKQLALGLVVGGLVEGVATGEGVTSSRIRFRLCKQSELSGGAIEAALRGPALPFELELIDR